MDDLRYKIIQEELEEARRRILTRIRGLPKDGQRTMKLQFKNGITQAILTGEEIKGQDKNPLEVVLVDESTGNIVDVEPESSATVKILLLQVKSNASEGDDWTVEQFNENIVREEDGKKPLLAGNKFVKLRNGIGSLINMKFRHRATKMRPSVFKLGARVVDTFHGVRTKEAKTESFIVKDFRNKYYIKHETPSLSDEVFRLKNIRKGGIIQKRLQDHKIRTVENFLIQLLIDRQGLKTMVNLGEKKWKLTVKNALACPSDKRMSYYTNEQKTTGIVFDLFGQILGLYMEGQYTLAKMLSGKHKADAEKLLECACKQWEKVEPFVDEESPQHHPDGLDFPGGSHENAQTSETNSLTINQTGVGDCSLFRTDEADAEKLLECACKHGEKVGPLVDEESPQQNLDGLDCPGGSHENARTSETNFPTISQTGVGDCSLFRIDDVENSPIAFLRHRPVYSSDFDIFS